MTHNTIDSPKFNRKHLKIEKIRSKIHKNVTKSKRFSNLSTVQLTISQTNETLTVAIKHVKLIYVRLVLHAFNNELAFPFHYDSFAREPTALVRKSGIIFLFFCFVSIYRGLIWEVQIEIGNQFESKQTFWNLNRNDKKVLFSNFIIKFIDI